VCTLHFACPWKRLREGHFQGSCRKRTVLPGKLCSQLESHPFVLITASRDNTEAVAEETSALKLEKDGEIEDHTNRKTTMISVVKNIL
jgi:hypothetical protein